MSSLNNYTDIQLTGKCFILAAILLILSPAKLLAQDSGGSLSFQTNIYPSLRIADQQFPNSKTYTISAKRHHMDESPLEYGLHLTFGYHPSIAFSYGASLACLIQPFDDALFKTGFVFDLIQMNQDALTDYFSEEQDPEDAHESLSLFLEWEVFPVHGLSFFINGNYRFTTSERLVSSEIIDERTGPDGSARQIVAEEYTNIFYSSGFHIGLGFQIHF